MALQITKETIHGVDAEYWKITEMRFNWWNNFATCKLSGFVNQQARTDNKVPLKEYGFRFNGDDFDFNVDGQLVEALYLKIKALADWTSAVEV